MFGLAGCNNSWTWHQKITVSVSTPGGVKTASSIMQASIGEKGGWWSPAEATGAITSVSGEAVALEVAPGKYLFALLRDTPPAYEVFFPDVPPLEIAAKLPGLPETRELMPSQYPMLVTFVDLDDPASVKRVDPMRLDAAFGAGYRLNSISMSITNEPVQRGRIKQVLPWIEWSREKLLVLGGGLNPVRFKEGKKTYSLDRAAFATRQ